MRRTGLTFADGLLILVMLAWLSVAVGPWWFGVLLFGLVWVANTIVGFREGRRRRDSR